MDPNDNIQPGIDPAPVDATADALAALDAGIASADEGQPDPAPAAEPVDPAPAADPAPAEPAPQDPPAGDPPPADPAADPAAPDAEPVAPPAADAETEKEIGELGLKEKSAERFRALAADVKELAPIRDALKQAGIEDISKLPDLIQRSQVGEDMVKMVMDTGANPEQYGQALDYLGLIAKASKGDVASAEKAYTVMEQELRVLATMLGKEVPGVHDPLAAHPDLRAEVEAGDLPKARAVEIAGQRAKSAVTTQAQQREQEQSQAQQQAEQGGIAWLQEFDADARARDPDYLAKRPALNEAVAHIRATLHPSQWPQATALAYARIQAPAAAAPAAPAAPALPRPGPLRPTGPRPAMAPAFDDPMKALDFGIEQANNSAV